MIAYSWSNIAATNGYVFAAQMRAAIAKEMTLDEVTKAQEFSKEMLKRNPKLILKK